MPNSSIISVPSVYTTASSRTESTVLDVSMVLLIPYLSIVSSIFLWLRRLPGLFCSVTLLVSFIIINLKWGTWLYYLMQHLHLHLLMHSSPSYLKNCPQASTYQHVPEIENPTVENKGRTESALHHEVQETHCEPCSRSGAFSISALLVMMILMHTSRQLIAALKTATQHVLLS